MRRISTILLLIIVTQSHAQQKEFNPFESIGKPGKILTLSKGKYTEVHINDSLQRIGSVIVNMYSGSIYDILDTDTLYNESNLDPTVITRWYSPDPVTKHNESPYASMSNNPIWFGDKDGRDTLMMHRKLMPEYTKYDYGALVYKVTFSVIRDGVETKMDQVMYMLGNAMTNTGHNALPKPYYKLTFQQMSEDSGHRGEEGWENTVHVVGGVYFHPGNFTGKFGGCFGLSTSKPIKFGEYEPGKGYVKIANTIAALEVLRQMYNTANGTDNSLTGDKFVLKTNSVATSSKPKVEVPAAPATQEEMPRLKALPATQGYEGPKEIIKD